MIRNSYKKALDLTEPKTEAGKPLLQICIDNENSDRETWQLKNLMKILLHYIDLNPDVDDDAG
jgi:hypothetical protein